MATPATQAPIDLYDLKEKQGTVNSPELQRVLSLIESTEMGILQGMTKLKLIVILKLHIFSNKKFYLNLNSKITTWPLSATSSVQL